MLGKRGKQSMMIITTSGTRTRVSNEDDIVNIDNFKKFCVF